MIIGWILNVFLLGSVYSNGEKNLLQNDAMLGQ